MAQYSHLGSQTFHYTEGLSLKPALPKGTAVRLLHQYIQETHHKTLDLNSPLKFLKQKLYTVLKKTKK